MKLVKKFAAAVAAMALTVAMTTSCFAASWGSYFGQNEGWYEGAYGELKSSTDTSWTANMDAIGWGGCWGGQVFQQNLKIKKGDEYQLKFNMTSSKCDKWVFIKIATGDDIAYGDWIQLKAGKTTKYDVTFKAKVDADSIYFGIGGDFGDRAEEQIKQRELFTSTQRQNQMMVMLHTLQNLNVQVTHLQQLRQQAQIQHQMIMHQQTAQIQQVLQQIQQAQA